MSNIHLVEFSTEELELIKDALGAVRFLKPRQSKVTEASLCKRISELLENPNKDHPFNKPRLMPWMKKQLS